MSPNPETAADLVQARLSDLVADVLALEPGARADSADGIHAMRVAARRVRSLLATYRPVLDQDRSEPLRDELGWLTGLLGDVRDPEVLLLVIASILDQQPGEHQRGRARASLEEGLTAERRRAHHVLVSALDSARYRLLVGELNRAAADAPLTEAADGPARKLARKRLRHDWRRLERIVDALPDDASGRALDQHLHQVRKAAKRVRYAAETAECANMKKATRVKRAATTFQERLGHHQDALLTEAYVGRLAVEAAADGEDTFTYDLVAGFAAADVEHVVGEFRTLWERLLRADPDA